MRPDINYTGSDWSRLEEWLTAELHETYRRLAGLNIDERETQQMRGRASIIGMMLDFRTTPPPIMKAAL